MMRGDIGPPKSVAQPPLTGPTPILINATAPASKAADT
jgi:hypothetical protein